MPTDPPHPQAGDHGLGRALAPPAARVGRHLVAPQRPPVAGRDGGRRDATPSRRTTRTATSARATRASRDRRNPDYDVGLRVRQRPSVRRPRVARRRRARARMSIQNRAPTGSRASCATRRDTTSRSPSCRRRDRARCSRPSRRSTASSATRPEVRSRAHVREQGRGRRREQSASALPDLRDELRLPHDRGRRSRRRRSTSPSTAACCFDDIIDAEEADGRRARRRSRGARCRSCRTSRAIRTRRTSRRARRTRASPTCRRSELDDFADVLRRTLVRMDNLWRMSFPYVMVLHQAPTDGARHPGFHFHIQIHPPLRKPGLLKYLAGRRSAGATS